MSVVGFGTVCIDYMVYLDELPAEDSKVKAKKARILGGGNIGNTLTAIQRLGVPCVLISKVGSDSVARDILAGFNKEGIDTSLVMSGVDMSSSFTYVMVTPGSRTCIHTGIKEDVTPNEILCTVTMLKETVVNAGGVAMMHLDSRHTFAATVMARWANEERILTTLDCEKDREHFQDLLPLADILFTNQNYPGLHKDLVGDTTSESNVYCVDALGSASSSAVARNSPPPPPPPPPPSAPPTAPLSSSSGLDDAKGEEDEEYRGDSVAVSGKDALESTSLETDAELNKCVSGMEILLKQGRARMVVTTLGDRGSILMTRLLASGSEGTFKEAVDVEYWTELLSGLNIPDKKEHEYMIPFLETLPMKTHVPVWAESLRERGVDVVVCDAFPISARNIIDTTGAGDAFIGGFITGICSHFSPTLCLKLATFTAAEKLKGHGGRQSLPSGSSMMMSRSASRSRTPR